MSDHRQPKPRTKPAYRVHGRDTATSPEEWKQSPHVEHQLRERTMPLCWAPTNRVTDDPNEITCKACRKALGLSEDALATDCTHDRLITLGTSEDGLEEEYKCLDCGRVVSTLDK